MNKTIVKTAVITLAVLLVLTTLLYSIVAIFAPQKMSDFYSDMGENELALKYQERVYKKQPSVNNLILVINLSIAADEEDETIFYVEELIKRENADQVNLADNYYDFVIFNYCVALCDEDQTEKAISVALEYSSEYNSADPIRRLAAYSVENQNKYLANKVLQALNSFDLTILSPENSQLLQTDIENLASYLQ